MEYCCRTGKPMGLIDCDRCHSRQNYNASIRMGLAITEAGWTAPGGYTKLPDGSWRVMSKLRKPTSTNMPSIERVVSIKYKVGDQVFGSLLELENHLICERLKEIGFMDGATASSAQNDELREYIADHIDAIAETRLYAKNVVDVVRRQEQETSADPPPSSEG